MAAAPEVVDPRGEPGEHSATLAARVLDSAGEQHAPDRDGGDDAGAEFLRRRPALPAQRGALVPRMGTADQPRRELLAGQAVHEVLDALQPQHPGLQWVIATDRDHVIITRASRTDTAEK